MIKLTTKKILVPVDFSATSVHALKHACFLASKSEGEVLMLHIIQRNHEAYNILLPEVELDTRMKDVGMVIEKRLRILGEEMHKMYGIPVRDIVSTGNVSLEINRIVKEEACTMIVMGTQGYSAVEMLFIGSNTMKVLGSSSVPVMSVRTEPDHEGFSSIVLPIDSSDHSRQKVPVALDLAKKFDATVHLLGLSDGHSNFDKKLEVIFKQIEDIAEKKHVTITKKILNEVPNRAKATISFMDEVKADLLVIMDDQNAEISGIFLGPYSSQVINYSKVPVLTFHPEEGHIKPSTPGAGGI